jgi:hypothetical protein
MSDRPLPILARPWFWALLIGSLFSVPLIKSLGAELPPPLPGMDSDPVRFTLPDDKGRDVSLSDLRGHLVLVTEMPLANAPERDSALRSTRALRKRLRGLGSAVIYLSLAHGGRAEVLSDLIDEATARKPVNVFLLDEDHGTMDGLRALGHSSSADYFLLDRHGRIRGVYDLAHAPFSENPEAQKQRNAADQEELDRLVADAGQLANWAASDLAPKDD